MFRAVACSRPKRRGSVSLMDGVNTIAALR
jgi:hypothetical protein